MKNGEDIEVKSGDKYIPLPARLDALDEELGFIKKMLFFIGVILLIHFIKPDLNLFDLMIQAIGL